MRRQRQNLIGDRVRKRKKERESYLNSGLDKGERRRQRQNLIGDIEQHRDRERERKGQKERKRILPELLP